MKNNPKEDNVDDTSESMKMGKAVLTYLTPLQLEFIILIEWLLFSLYFAYIYKMRLQY